MASGMYGHALALLASGDLDLNGTFKLLLLGGSAAFNKAHQYVSQVSGYEIACTGYEAGFSGSGRKEIDLATDLAPAGTHAVVTFTEVVWAVLGGAVNTTVRAAAIYLPSTSDADSLLLFFLALDPTETMGDTKKLKVSDEGNVTISS